jgi:hypothetical protein
MKEFLCVVFSLCERFSAKAGTQGERRMCTVGVSESFQRIRSVNTHMQFTDTEKYQWMTSAGGFFVSRRVHFVIMEDLVGKVLHPLKRSNSSSPNHPSLSLDI